MSKDSLSHKKFKSGMRRQRTRSRLHGTAEKPRLSIHISNRQVSVQIINDDEGRTLAYTTTVGHKIDGPMTDKATWAGAEIAKKAQKAKVKKVVFDRGEYRYHGRAKKLAEAARAGGLEF
ncbi:50S ribosomal protein L18 [Candidatus Saccharibacteria bacterium]|nr:50S ribosomal protein L18 [Candidatus Saccharibacteria bacterium]